MPWYSVCTDEAEDRHGCRFWRSSSEEAAGGGGFVQPGPLPLHLHPSSGSQDPWPAQTAQKLRLMQKQKDWPELKYSSYWRKSAVKQHQKMKLPGTPIFVSVCFSSWVWWDVEPITTYGSFSYRRFSKRKINLHKTHGIMTHLILFCLLISLFSPLFWQ